MGLFKPRVSRQASEAPKTERGKHRLGKDTDRRSKRERRAEESLEDPTVTEARISLDDTYYGPRPR
jgi:hypothetical protein